MKISVACIYWFLYCTFVVSSCLLVILVSTEGVSSSVPTATILQEVIDKINNTEQERTNHNPEDNQYIIDQEPKVVSSFQEGQDEVQPVSNIGSDFTQFEAASQNAGVASEFGDVEPEVVVTLVDSATLELKQRVDASHEAIFQSSQQILDETQDSSNVTEVVLEAPPVADAVSVEKQDATTEAVPPENRSDSSSSVETEDNLVLKVVIPQEGTTTPAPTNVTEENVQQPEDIPSFSEWAQKQLEEAEKKKELVNSSAQNQNSNGGKPASSVKLRSKNYASPDCGAKIVAANPEAVSAGAVLSPSRDEYKLNACTNRIWFIVELCEAIQAKKIDLANFELFSSSPKEFSVSVSDRFPSREWSSVGHFTAKDERDVQSFELHPHLFGKYIRVEMHSHHGSEHYCPISLFRVYGTSEFEVLEKEDRDQSHFSVPEDDDDDDDEIMGANGDVDEESPKNLYGAARDAVMSIVKKAAEVLGNSGNVSASDHKRSDNSTVLALGSTNATPLIKSCSTPSHLVVCDNCSDVLYGYVYELLSCHGRYLQSLLMSVKFINRTLRKTDICEKYGLSFGRFQRTLNSYAYVNTFFSETYVAAFCNVLAVLENKVVLNISDQYTNVTETPTDVNDNLFNISVSVSTPHITQPVEKTPSLDEKWEDTTSVKDAAVTATVVTQTDVSVDGSVAAQIKPTKTFSKEEDAAKQENNTEPSKAETVLEDINPTVVATATHPSSSDLAINVSSSTSVEADNNRPKNESSTNTIQENLEQLDAGVDNPDLEAADSLDEQLNKLISELGSADITASSISTTVTPPTSMPQAQKESIFVRLANRIRALERNMSLSSQYLEELSRRYKKQVEDMQRLLDKTLATLKEENRKKEERDLQVQEQLTTLTATINMLMVEKDSWSHTASKFGQFLLLQVTVVFLFVYCCWKNPETKFSNVPPTQKSATVTRRKSIDVIRRPTDVVKKNDSVSGIVDCSNRVHREVVHPDEVDSCLLAKLSKAERKRRKKKHSLQRSLSITHIDNGQPSEEVGHFNGNSNVTGATRKIRRSSAILPIGTSTSASYATSSKTLQQQQQHQDKQVKYKTSEIATIGNRLAIQLDACPVALDEMEHVLVPDCGAPVRDKSPCSSGGNGTTAAGTKHVRVASNPIYMKTALSTRYNRSLSYTNTLNGGSSSASNASLSAGASPSPSHRQNGSGGGVVNGNGQPDSSSTKSLTFLQRSMSSQHRRRSPTTSNSVDSSNSLDAALNPAAGTLFIGAYAKKDKKGGFKRIFKKVFD